VDEVAPPEVPRNAKPGKAKAALKEDEKKLGRQSLLEQLLFEPAEVGIWVPPEA
jgi:hypothetical protein